MSRKRGSSHDPTPQHVIGIEGTGMIPGILDVLSPREASVITLRYGLRDGAPRTLDEIGKEFGVSRERIREIVINALQALRDSQIGLALAAPVSPDERRFRGAHSQLLLECLPSGRVPCSSPLRMSDESLGLHD